MKSSGKHGGIQFSIQRVVNIEVDDLLDLDTPPFYQFQFTECGLQNEQIFNASELNCVNRLIAELF